MTGYIVSFAVYTLAMIGVIFVAFIVAKKTMFSVSGNSKNQFLSIENSISLGARKTIYVIKAGDERFLVASDPEKSTFLTKLGQKSQKADFETIYEKSEKQDSFEAEAFDVITTPPKSDFNRKKSVMRGIIEKLEKETTNTSAFNEFEIL